AGPFAPRGREPAVPIAGDRDHVGERTTDLARPIRTEGGFENRHERRPRSAVDEDAEAEAESGLVLAVQPFELDDRLGRLAVVALFAVGQRRDARRWRPGARSSADQLDLLVLRHREGNRCGAPEPRALAAA